MPAYLGDSDRALRRIELGALPAEREVWLLTRRDARGLARVRAVSDYVQRVFERDWPNS